MQAWKKIAISPGYAEGVAVVYDYQTDYRLEFPDHALRKLDGPAVQELAQQALRCVNSKSVRQLPFQ